MQLPPERHRRATSSALSSEIRKPFDWRFQPKPSNSCPPCKHQNLSIWKQQQVFNLHNFFGVDHLNLNSAEPQALNSICQQHQHLEDVSFPILPDNSVTVHLVQDNFDLITPELAIKDLEHFKQSLGGPSPVLIKHHHISLFAPQSLMPPRYPMIHSTNSSQAFGKPKTVSPRPKSPCLKKNDTLCPRYRKQQLSRMADTKSGLLWHPNASLPNNFTAAIQQFKKMKHRLSQQPDLHAMYQDTIDKDIERGYIRESHEVPSTGWILPEHSV